jgi:hypothetical protein
LEVAPGSELQVDFGTGAEPLPQRLFRSLFPAKYRRLHSGA